MALTFTPDAATIGATEYSLPADSTTLAGQTDDCYLEVMLDLSNLTFTEEYRWRVYETINGGTRKPYLEGAILGSQAQHMKIECGIVGSGWDVTLQKIAGTDRSIGWILEKDTPDVNVATWLGSAPNALVSGRVDASVGAMAANTMTAAAAAADLTTELQAGLATAAALNTVDDFLDTEIAAILAAVDTEIADIRNRLPAALVGGRMDSSVGAMGANVLTASAFAADAVAKIWDEVYEGARTVRGFIRVARALLINKANTLTTNPAFRDDADTKNRVAFTMSGAGATRTPVIDET